MKVYAVAICILLSFALNSVNAQTTTTTTDPLAALYGTFLDTTSVVNLFTTHLHTLSERCKKYTVWIAKRIPEYTQTSNTYLIY